MQTIIYSLHTRVTLLYKATYLPTSDLNKYIKKAERAVFPKKTGVFHVARTFL